MNEKGVSSRRRGQVKGVTMAQSDPSKGKYYIPIKKCFTGRQISSRANAKQSARGK